MTMFTDAAIKQLENKGIPDPMIAGLNEHLGQVADSMTRFRTGKGRLKASNDYNAEGLKRRIAEVAQAAANELLGIQNSAHGYSDNIKQMEDNLKPTERPTDSTLAFLEEKEVRERLADLDELQLQIKYQTACGEGGHGADLIAAAVENDPMPRLSRDVIDEGKQARGRRTNPAEAKKLQQVIQVRAVLFDAIQEAMGELEKNGLPADDFLMRMVKGELPG